MLDDAHAHAEVMAQGGTWYSMYSTVQYGLYEMLVVVVMFAGSSPRAERLQRLPTWQSGRARGSDGPPRAAGTTQSRRVAGGKEGGGTQGGGEGRAAVVSLPRGCRWVVAWRHLLVHCTVPLVLYCTSHCVWPEREVPYCTVLQVYTADHAPHNKHRRHVVQ